jgi:hypothetical protein
MIKYYKYLDCREKVVFMVYKCIQKAAIPKIKIGYNQSKIFHALQLKP